MGHGETGMTAATTHRIARWSEAAARPRADADGAWAPESTRAGSVQRERAGADAAEAGRQASVTQQPSTAQTSHIGPPSTV